MASSIVDFSNTILMIESSNSLARDAFELPHNRVFVIYRGDDDKDPQSLRGDRRDTPCISLPITTCALRISHRSLKPDTSVFGRNRDSCDLVLANNISKKISSEHFKIILDPNIRWI